MPRGSTPSRINKIHCQACPLTGITSGEIGTLAPGAHADLLVVDGDPLTDLAVLTRPERHLRHVVKAGAVL
ncbi:hypothetical protein OG321_00740 [Streptomyces sp. NBC_00424]|uniref:hypothetical protein n=1 Tax=Streptomyces sp. NBC_00424 TaxID=2903648 RepID=UPI00225411DD|nr:hypothetical protein [Streptomyces sp. NBC_00424]MCX5071066.1 hypothetical protein [Streptomyces sp. NBC_00424]